MDIRISESSIEDFALPRADTVKKLHKLLQKRGMAFRAAWLESSGIAVTLEWAEKLSSGVLLEHWDLGEKYVIIRMVLHSGARTHGPRHADCDVDEDDVVAMTRALRVRQ